MPLQRGERCAANSAGARCLGVRVRACPGGCTDQSCRTMDGGAMRVELSFKLSKKIAQLTKVPVCELRACASNRRRLTCNGA